MKEMITKIVELWFLSEPALFAIYCNQQLRENKEMHCTVRCGKGFVEFNPDNLEKTSMAENILEEQLRVEMIRLYLKHPYQRQPENCLSEARTLGSNMVLGQHYRLPHTRIIPASTFQLPSDQCFEWYVYQLDAILRQPSDTHRQGLEDEQATDGAGEPQEADASPKNPSNQENNGTGITEEERRALADQSELWEEDELRQQEVNEIIRDTTNWGTLAGDIVEQIRASLVVRLDYRKVLSSFHTSILSSRRRLTRMKPNRRSGFAQMGSRYDLASHLLVAVDVSGSISTRTLNAFYSAIARFFKYGVETIDVVQFDVRLGEVTTFRKRPRTVEVHGRGGTSFQEIFDHLKEHREYDGCIIFTDGYASKPKVDFPLRTKTLWICRNEKEYNQHSEWMRETGKACWIDF